MQKIAEAHIVNKKLTKSDIQIAYIKKGIWVYFLLLIFEGALRKWFLPGLSSILLLVREPVAIYLIFKSVKYKVFKQSFLLTTLVIIGFISILTALFFGHQNFFVALFGARIFIIQIPLIFIFKELINNEDIINIGKTLLWMTIMMTIIIVLQFYSPQSAWINRGIGGDDAGAGFTGAMGYMRPSGTFSFTNGLANFYALTTPFIFFFLFNSKIKVQRWLLLGALASLILAVPFSISRTVLFNVSLGLAFSMFIVVRNPKVFFRIVGGLVAMMVMLFIASKNEGINLALTVFTARFDSANSTEGGLVEGVFVDRFLGGMYNALFSEKEVSLFGGGIGMGSNVGANLLAGSSRFLLPEGEWGRIIGELGPILGMIVVLIRIGLAFSLVGKAFSRLKVENIFPWLLMSTGAISIMQGQWGQPTNLGFFIMFTGLAMAATSKKNAIMFSKVTDEKI